MRGWIFVILRMDYDTVFGKMQQFCPERVKRPGIPGRFKDAAIPRLSMASSPTAAPAGLRYARPALRPAAFAPSLGPVIVPAATVITNPAYRHR
jgi:hypothetical protein